MVKFSSVLSMPLEQQGTSKGGHMGEADLEKMTISVKLSDLDTLAYYIVEIDESKGNRKATQVSIDNAHKKIMSILGQHTHLIYQPDD